MKQALQLHEAANNGFTTTCMRLLRNGIDPNIKDKYQWTPLMYAATGGHLATTLLLMAHGADVEHRVHNEPLLHRIADKGDVEIFNALVTGGADITARDEKDWTVLHHAVLHGRIEIVRRLIELGLNINQNSHSGKTPLHMAADLGNIEVCRLLVMSGATINAKDSDFKTPLHFSAQSGNELSLELLLEAGANTEAIDKEGKRPMDCVPKHRPDIIAIFERHALPHASKDRGFKFYDDDNEPKLVL